MLREDINEGRLQPGDELVISRIAERFDISAIPVREALRVLSAEGPITLAAHLKLYAPSGSPVLLDLIATLLERTERYRHLAMLLDRDSPSEIADEHRRLTRLVAESQAPQAVEELKRHLDRAARRLPT